MENGRTRIDKAIYLVQNYKKKAIPISYATANIVKLLKIRHHETSAKVMQELSKDNPCESTINKLLRK